MQGPRVAAGLVAAAALMFGLSARPGAFHSGGTGDCAGCHSMHSAHASGSVLLKQSDASSVCLTCHQGASDAGPTGHHVSTPESSMPAGVAPLQRTPGGDFGWLKKAYAYSAEGAPVVEDGSSHGHNIVAADFGYAADPTRTVSPGGAYPVTELACTSCHDPHGRYRRLANGVVAKSGGAIIASGSYSTSPIPSSGQAVGVYRLLAGEGYTRAGSTFTGAPAAVAPATYNRTEASTQTRIAYGRGDAKGHETWTRWCATCHTQMVAQGHTADVALETSMLSAYAAYRKSGDLTGTFATSYSSLVPFEQNTQAVPLLAARARNDDSALQGPESGDRVGCLTCHRAHASGWEYGMRWNEKAAFLTWDGAWPGSDTTPAHPEYARGRTAAETRAAYYDRPVGSFATYQRTLCNKCHTRD
jgi:predicted CXXCH cytochrome family protein